MLVGKMIGSDVEAPDVLDVGMLGADDPLCTDVFSLIFASFSMNEPGLEVVSSPVAI